MLTIEQMNKAARIIEIEGADGYVAAAREFGREAAMLLLVAHLRRAAGSMDSFPPDSAIDASVIETVDRIIKEKAHA